MIKMAPRLGGSDPSLSEARIGERLGSDCWLGSESDPRLGVVQCITPPPLAGHRPVRSLCDEGGVTLPREPVVVVRVGGVETDPESISR